MPRSAGRIVPSHACFTAPPMPCQAGTMTPCQKFMNAGTRVPVIQVPIASNTGRITPSHAACAAALMPFHAPSTTCRNQSNCVYA